MSSSTAPKTVEAFHQRLKEISGALPKRMRQCAEYLASNSDLIALRTVAELAASAQVQPSAIMRFCQIMGFSGFSEMQKMFREEVPQVLPDYKARLERLRQEDAASPAALLAEFVDAGRNSLEKLTVDLDTEQLKTAVDVLSKAEVIHVIGLRRAYPVATYLSYALEKSGVACVLHDNAGKLQNHTSIRDGDAVVAVTFSPYSPETVELTEYAASNSVPVVAITDTVLSPVTNGGMISLLVSEVEFGSFHAISASLALAITLAMSVATQRETSF